MVIKDRVRQYYNQNGNKPADFYQLLTIAKCRAETLNRHLGEMIEANELVEVPGRAGLLRLDTTLNIVLAK